MSEEPPDWELAIVDKAKIVNYLLNITKSPGSAKARFFLAFGFRTNRWEIMTIALKKHAKSNVLVKTSESVFGEKFEIEGPIQSPDGRNPRIVTVWQVDKEHLAPRLITAYPYKK